MSADLRIACFSFSISKPSASATSIMRASLRDLKSAASVVRLTASAGMTTAPCRSAFRASPAWEGGYHHRTGTYTDMTLFLQGALTGKHIMVWGEVPAKQAAPVKKPRGWQPKEPPPPPYPAIESARRRSREGTRSAGFVT